MTDVDDRIAEEARLLRDVAGQLYDAITAAEHRARGPYSRRLTASALSDAATMFAALGQRLDALSRQVVVEIEREVVEAAAGGS